MRLRQGRVGTLVVAVCTVGAALAGCGGKSGDTASSSISPSGSVAASAPASKTPPGEGKNRAGDPLPGLPSTADARKQLAALKVEKPHPMSGYSRARFPHWAQQGNKCDTRETVLERDGKGVKRDGECRAVAGTWHSLYDDKTADKAGQVDIDHIVPLANAWRSGADKWDDDRRKAFANDLTHPQLLTVSAGSNRSKGDQSPDQWQPPAKSAWCFYGRAWTSVKSTYGLSVTEEERGMLTKMMDTCTS